MLKDDHRVRFDVYQQHFIELLRNQDLLGALTFAQSHLSQQSGLDADMQDRLEKTCALAAFTDITQSRNPEYASMDHRSRVAELIKTELLKYNGMDPISNMEHLIRVKVSIIMLHCST